MNADWLDWMGVVLIVASAALWLGLHLRRYWHRRPPAGEKFADCSAGCAGCPLAKECKRH